MQFARMNVEIADGGLPGRSDTRVESRRCRKGRRELQAKKEDGSMFSTDERRETRDKLCRQVTSSDE